MLVFLLVLVMASLSLVVRDLSTESIVLQRQAKDREILQQAKAALIAFAVSQEVATKGPGYLPCPDLNLPGSANAGKAGTTCSSAASRLGRLPWYTLKIPPLEDSSGEPLWYAVASGFRTGANLLDSDTPGSISLRDAQGNLRFDAGSGNGIVALVIAPGAPLRRLDGLLQERDPTHQNKPAHYLDIGPTEDNADFVDNTSNGFFGDSTGSANGNASVNDRIAFITQAEIMTAIEQRVLAEVALCFKAYAADPANQGHYPWLADLSASAGGDYDDKVGVRFGRIPDLMCHTGGDDEPPFPPPLCVRNGSKITGTVPGMMTTWGSAGDCRLGAPWFKHWREHVFVAIAEPWQPGNTVPDCGDCLVFQRNGLPPLPGRSAIIVIAGRALAGQSRTIPVKKADIANYLERDNASPHDGRFEARPASPDFNDQIRVLPLP